MAVKKTNVAASATSKTISVLNNIDKIQASIKLIDEFIEKAKEGLDLGLQEYELSVQEQKIELTNSLKSFEEKLNIEKQALIDKDNKAKLDRNRELEELEYQHSQAIDKQYEDTMDSIATKFNKVIVDTEEWETMLNDKLIIAQTHQQELEEAINKAKSEVYREKGAELTKFKNDYIIEAAQQKARIESLEKTIELLNVQLGEAKEREQTTNNMAKEMVASVASSQPNITVESGKR